MRRDTEMSSSHTGTSLAAAPQAAQAKGGTRKRRHMSTSAKLSDFMAELRKKHLVNGSGAPVLVAKDKNANEPEDDSSSTSGQASETDSDDNMYLDESDVPYPQRRASKQSWIMGEESGEDGGGSSETCDDAPDDSNTKTGRRHQCR
jgi:hypothetical protein